MMMMMMMMSLCNHYVIMKYFDIILCWQTNSWVHRASSTHVSPANIAPVNNRIFSEQGKSNNGKPSIAMTIPLLYVALSIAVWENIPKFAPKKETCKRIKVRQHWQSGLEWRTFWQLSKTVKELISHTVLWQSQPRACRAFKHHDHKAGLSTNVLSFSGLSW